MCNSLSRDKILNRLKTKVIGQNILIFDEVSSTNEEAKNNINFPNGSVFIAKKQTNGRGRRGREWSSKSGGVWMSVLLRPQITDDKLSQLTLIAGLSVNEAMKRFGIAPKIKWPNDVVVSGKKISGILTELLCDKEQNPVVIVGIGINVNISDFPDEIKDVATSVFVETKKEYDLNDIIKSVLEEFEEKYNGFLKDKEKFIVDYKQNLLNLDKEVRVITPGGEYTGVASGITSKGELIVRTKDEERVINSGEVSVRGILGYC